MVPTPTQTHLDIRDIQSDLVILKDGSACIVLEVSAVNFGLFSEKEQEATIYAYAQLLNSLTFSIQIVVSSKRKDISDYITRLEKYLAKTESPKIRKQLGFMDGFRTSEKNYRFAAGNLKKSRGKIGGGCGFRSQNRRGFISGFLSFLGQ